MNLIHAGEHDVNIGNTPPFFTRPINSVPSSIIVRSAVKLTSKTFLNPILLNAEAILPSTFVPIGNPNSSPKPTLTDGAVPTTTYLFGSASALRTSST